jgi:hypothetical protein
MSMSDVTDPPCAGAPGPTRVGRRPWRTPRLVRYGSMRRLVRSISGGNNEPGGPGMAKAGNSPYFFG